MGKVVVTCRYYYEPLDCVVHVNVRRNCQQFVARWHGPDLHLSCPHGVSPEEVEKALAGMTPKLQNSRPKLHYEVGQTIETPDYTFRLVSSGRDEANFDAKFTFTEAFIDIGARVDMSLLGNVQALSRMLKRIAYKVAPAHLYPQAKEISERLGVKPTRWKISSGLQTLGRCSAKGEISLSCALLFLPLHLREYVICHELAHLTELNHSERFHALCDSYLGGREKALIAELHRFNWPILR